MARLPAVARERPPSYAAARPGPAGPAARVGVAIRGAVGAALVRDRDRDGGCCGGAGAAAADDVAGYASPSAAVELAAPCAGPA